MRNLIMMANVCRQSIDAGRDGPNMQIVHSTYSPRIQNRRLDCLEVDMPRRALEQHVYRLKDQAPSSVDNYQTNNYAAEGVGPKPVKRNNRKTGEDSSNRTK